MLDAITTNEPLYSNEKVAGYLQQYAALFQRQIAKGWPGSFAFPKPQDHDQKAALYLVVAGIIKTYTGMGPIRFIIESSPR